jgi:hypothetical protein
MENQEGTAVRKERLDIAYDDFSRETEYWERGIAVGSGPYAERYAYKRTEYDGDWPSTGGYKGTNDTMVMEDKVYDYDGNEISYKRTSVTANSEVDVEPSDLDDSQTLVDEVIAAISNPDDRFLNASVSERINTIYGSGGRISDTVETYRDIYAGHYTTGNYMFTGNDVTSKLYTTTRKTNIAYDATGNERDYTKYEQIRGFALRGQTVGDTAQDSRFVPLSRKSDKTTIQWSTMYDADGNPVSWASYSYGDAVLPSYTKQEFIVYDQNNRIIESLVTSSRSERGTDATDDEDSIDFDIIT